jgi:hypothetical protein
VWLEGNVVCAKLMTESISDDWYPRIHSGYYSFGEKVHYLFAQKVSGIFKPDDNNSVQITSPYRGAPVIVTDDRGRFLRCVVFSDDVKEITLYNVERFSELETDTIYLMYDDLEDVQVTINGIPADFTLSGNVLVLSSPLKCNDYLVVRYRLRNSYCLRPCAAFARKQNIIVEVPLMYSISRVGRYSVFDLAYITPQYL